MANVLKTNLASEVHAKLYLNDDLADVRFVFGTGDHQTKVPANKANLAALSPVFYAMFFGSMKEGNEVNIADADVESFKEFLQFFYLSEMILTMENMEAVVRLADRYNILEYVESCATFSEDQWTTENICWGFQLALCLEKEPLIRFCERKIIESSDEVLATEMFKQCPKDTLKRILSMDLNCSEVEIFVSVLMWAKNACRQNGLNENQGENLKNQLGDCLKLIPFESMKFKEFTSAAALHQGLFTAEEFEDIVFIHSVDGYKAKIFNKVPRRYTWNDSHVIKCERKYEFADSMLRIHSTEVIKFTTNQEILLGELFSARTRNDMANKPPFFNNDINLIIYECDDNSDVKKVIHESLVSCVVCKTCFKVDSICCYVVKFTLKSPILIKPGTIYEICLKFKRNRNAHYWLKWQPKSVKLEDGVKIDFLKSSSVTYDTSTLGWIQGFGFNRILK